MPTICGGLDRVDDELHGLGWIQLRTVLSGGTAIRIRAFVGEQALIARGTERVGLSNLKAREFVEVTYHRGQAGFMEVETIYVRPNQGIDDEETAGRPWPSPQDTSKRL